jgi:CheY-like chemotaxis protein
VSEPHQLRGGVLIVDDDADIRSILGQILQMQGYSVQTAANGREALEALSSGLPPRVIVLDLMMPVMSGWDFRAQQRLRPEVAAVPVIVLTGGGGLRRDVQELDAAAWFAKPVDLEKLLDAISRLAT